MKLRLLQQIVRFIGGKALSLIKSPWVVVWLVFNYAANIQSYKRTANLLFQFVSGKSDAARCALCTDIMERMVDITGASDIMTEELDCTVLCPFQMKACLKICEALKDENNAVEFPCVRIRMCPPVDQFGEIPQCEWDWKQRACLPEYVCYPQRIFPVPKCELSTGYATWRVASGVVQQKAGALVTAVTTYQKCSAPGADPLFCVKEAEGGLDLFCDYMAWFLIVLVAPLYSMMAIATPGGGDDRQWLAFWISFFIFSILERFTVVTLSKFRFYYVMKLIAIFWLCWFNGAEQLYMFLHRWYASWNRFLRRNDFNRWVVKKLFGKDIETLLGMNVAKTEQQCLIELEEMMSTNCLTPYIDDVRTMGLQPLHEQLTNKRDIIQRYGFDVFRVLTKEWAEREYRVLEIDLISASDLPVMDYTLFEGQPLKCDAFVVFYLVPPSSKLRQSIAATASMRKREEFNNSRRTPSLSSSSPLPPPPPPPTTTTTTGKFLGTIRRIIQQQFQTLWMSRLYVRHGSGRFVPSFLSESGPDGLPGQYGRTLSHTVPKSLNPEWNTFYELQLLGGKIDTHGNFVNYDTPFTSLRVEVWDRNPLSDEFIGEFTVPLCPLITGMQYEIERSLTDPEGVSEAERLSGTVKLNLRLME